MVFKERDKAELFCSALGYAERGLCIVQRCVRFAGRTFFLQEFRDSDVPVRQGVQVWFEGVFANLFSHFLNAGLC